MKLLFNNICIYTLQFSTYLFYHDSKYKTNLCSLDFSLKCILNSFSDLQVLESDSLFTILSSLVSNSHFYKDLLPIRITTKNTYYTLVSDYKSLKTNIVKGRTYIEYLDISCVICLNDKFEDFKSLLSTVLNLISVW